MNHCHHISFRSHFFLKLKADNVEYDDPDTFSETLAAFGAKLDRRLMEQFAEEFTTSIVINNKKNEKVPLLDMADYYLARHPTEPPKAKPDKKKKKKKGDKDEKKGNKNKEKADNKEKSKKKGGKKKKDK